MTAIPQTDLLAATNWMQGTSSSSSAGSTLQSSAQAFAAQQGWTVVSTSNPQAASDGFFAASFLNANNQLVIVFKGPNFVTNMGALSTDAGISQGIAPEKVEADANQFMQTLFDNGSTSKGDSNTFVAGMSQGGMIAEYVGLQYGYSGVTLGAPGLPGYNAGNATFDNQPVSYQPSITNFAAYGDPVPNASTDSPVGIALGLSSQDHVGTVTWTGNVGAQTNLADELTQWNSLSVTNATPFTATASSLAGQAVLGSILSGQSVLGLSLYHNSGYYVPTVTALIDSQTTPVNGGGISLALPISWNGVPPSLPQGQSPGESGWSITYTIPSSSTGLQSTGLVDYYDASANQYVLGGGARISASAVTGLSYQNGNSSVQFATNATGALTGAGISVVQGAGSATVTDLGSGNQNTVAGTVNTNNLQPGQPVPVTTAAGTYHIDPATGDITDPGAIIATIGGNTVTIINPPGANDNSPSGGAFAVITSNAQAFPSNMTLSSVIS